MSINLMVQSILREKQVFILIIKLNETQLVTVQRSVTNVTKIQ